jgi:CubicO group peptidase (beta-lactamase class C family)
MEWRCRPGREAQIDDPARVVFEIGSITKAVLGLRLAQLVADGTVSLAERLVDQAPALAHARPAEEPPITLLHLATHTSGLPRLLPGMWKLPGFDRRDPYGHLTSELVFRTLAGVPLEAPPGTRYRYSNLGGGVLGDALCARFGIGFDELLEPVTAPLGMVDTRRALSTDGRERLAGSARAWAMPALTGAGGLYSTGADLGRLFEAAGADAIEERFAIDERTGVGLLWHRLRRPNGETLVWHNGRTAGSTAFVGFLAERPVGVVALAGVGTGKLDPLALAVLDEAAAR